MTPGIPPELAELVNLPEYPLIASSSFPATPSATVGTGPVALSAESRERESVGVAADGANRTEARVVADAATDIVTATATSEVGAIDLGPLMQLSGVRSSATVVQAASGELERATDFSIAAFSILGQQLRLGPDGLELAAVNLPLGSGTVLDPVESLLSSLEAQGITVRFIEAIETPEGVISAGVEVTRTFDLGVNGIVATVVMTLGRTFANVANAARAPIGGGGSPLFPSTPFSSPAGVGSAGLVAGSPATPTGALSSPAGAGAPAAAAPAGEQTISALVPEEIDGGRFYPVLALGAAVFVVGISLFRKIGVRSVWTS